MDDQTGTVTRFLRLDIESLSESETQAAVDGLCNRLFLETGQSPSTYHKMVAFARLFCGGDQEAGVADVMSKVLVELYPAGRLKAQNSRQLEGLLRTAIKNRLIDMSRRGRRLQSLDAAGAEPQEAPREASREESLEEVVAIREAFCAYLQHRDADADERREMQSLVTLLHETGGAASPADRRRILDLLQLSTATFYRRKSELIVAFLEYLDGS